MTLPPGAHAYGCSCEECRAMIAAICVKDSNGDYFFTDEELYQLALQHKPEPDAQ